MNLKSVVLGCAVSASMAVFGAMSAANAATYVYAGQWQVDSGPEWAGSPPNGPLAYTGREAAALLFGGGASNYVISTVDIDPAHINFSSWYSIIGYAGGHLLADNYSDKYLGLYYGPTSGYPSQDPLAAASAYINDNAIGSDFTNYAFLATGVPEPTIWAMLLLGFGGIGFLLRRQGARATLA